MKGYKFFESDWTYRGKLYEIGKIYEVKEKPEIYKRGFRFYKKIVDFFQYYGFDSENKVAEIEILGEIDFSGTKHCTNKFKILRELTWNEVLEEVNTGVECTGFCNSGDWNAGDWNAGDYNSGNYNTGDYNARSYNTGNRNTGNRNSGDYNSGNCNSGNWNAGDWNSGYGNTGYHNSGNYNTGDYNSGNWNSGNYNSGDYNKTSFSNGSFNTKEPKIFLFNKISNLTQKEWLNSEGRCILIQIPSDIHLWVRENDMTDDEKENHPEYKVTGGFLKKIKIKRRRQEWWNELSTREKDIVLSIPNFDKKIFKEITGIDVEQN